MLASGISKRYLKPFVLDSDSLSRIHACIEKATKELDAPTITVFHIERDDDRYYETENIDDVFSDPNVAGKKINFVGIGLKYTEKRKDAPWGPRWLVRVSFFKNKPSAIRNRDMIEIQIETENKNWALLLADELESQVERTLKAKSTPRWLLILCVLPLLLPALKLTALVFDIFNLTTSADISLLPIFSFFAFLLGISFSALYISDFDKGIGTWFIKLFGPESAFVWGDEAKSYSEREQTRHNILWGVIVAMLISLIASIAFAILWSSSNF